MKYLYLVVLFFLVTVQISAQSLPDSSGLSILQKKWRVKLVYAPDPRLTEDPLRASTETRQNINDAIETARSNAVNIPRGFRPILPPVRSNINYTPTQYSGGISPIIYTYQLKVRNSGTKKIQNITWDYVFFDSVTRKQLGQLQFTSKTNIRPNKTGNLIMRSHVSPTGITQAAETKKKLYNQYIEQVNIKSIKYADGSVWQADSK